MELQITALKNGTVIDHLPSEKTIKIMELLDLGNKKEKVTVAFNVDSKKGGTKGIIKISERRLSEKEMAKIGILAKGATVNIIDGYRVVEKKQIEIPEMLKDIVECSNPKCISNKENIKSKFQLEENDKIRCIYCERTTNVSEAVIK
jgi:aspartate carbamoyltransferase regulatory subunit